jgi:hypothetical protein
MSTVMDLVFKSSDVYLLPILNPDGFGNEQGVGKGSKNLGGETCETSDSDTGVNLDRNFDYKFGIDDIGSSADP